MCALLAHILSEDYFTTNGGGGMESYQLCLIVIEN